MSELTTWTLTADRIKRLAGGVCTFHRRTYPTSAGFQLFADPQTARLALLKWLNPGHEPPAELDGLGRVNWHELVAADQEKALAFYSEVFGWQKADCRLGGDGHISEVLRTRAIDRRYARQASGDPGPFWLFYFNIDDIDAAVQRVKVGGRPDPRRPVSSIG